MNWNGDSIAQNKMIAVPNERAKNRKAHQEKEI
jgi:hypothetical protein